jgi:hypothetical protein
MAHLPMLAIPTHQRFTSRAQPSARSLIDVLRFDQCGLQLHGASIHLDLMLRLWAKHHTRVPCLIGSAAQQQ